MLDALEILERFGIQLEQQKLVSDGSELLALCPFHQEKTPSFHLNIERCCYKCFGCQAAGHIYDVIEAYTELTRDEIRSALKGQLPPGHGRQSPYRKLPARRNRSRYLSREEIYLLTIYSEGLHILLMNEHGLSVKGLRDVGPWREYLMKQRGFSPEAIEYFGFGANAMRNYNRCFSKQMREVLKPLGINPERMLHDMGLVNRRGGDYYWKPVITIPYRYDGETYHMLWTMARSIWV